jgi:hypothetical protein
MAGNGHVMGSPMKKILWRVTGMLRRDGQPGNFYGGQSERTATLRTLRTEFSSASLSLSPSPPTFFWFSSFSPSSLLLEFSFCFFALPFVVVVVVVIVVEFLIK